MNDVELALAQAFARGERWAYDAAYRLHGSVLHAAAQQVLRDPNEAADCVHDVLLRLWRRGDAYCVERGSLRAFLAVCVRNDALARQRKGRNRARIDLTLEHNQATRDVADAVVDREAIRDALSALTEKQRVAVELAYTRHLTHEEIAATLREPAGTVKSRLSSALRKLRETLALGGPV